MPDGNNLILPEKDVAADFWRHFSPDDPMIRLRFVHHQRNGHAPAEVEGTINEVWPQVLDYQSLGYECYYFPNKIKPGTTGFATDQDVQVIRALFIDQDTEGLPEVWDPIVHAHPSFRVNTSLTVDGKQKGQLLWLIHPIAADDESFRNAQRRLVIHYKSDPALVNLSRILRLPGSVHKKDPARPQLVTFQTIHTHRRESSAILDGLAELQERQTSTGETQRAPIAEIVLRETLSYIDPPADEPTWRRLVAAIKATPLLDGDGEEVAVDWSAGRLDRRGRYVDAPPANWSDDEIVREKYGLAKESKPSGKIAGFGSLVWEAWQAGMPRDSRIPREWTEYADGKKEGSGPFLLRTSDLFGWPDPKPLVHDFLMQGEDACLYSPPKCGKTFVALDVSLSLAAGLPVLGQLNVLRPGEAVVYLSGEGHAGIKKRIRAWFQERGLAADADIPFFYKADVPATKEGTSAGLRYVAGISQFCRPVLIVIDTMSRSLGGEDENTAAAANAYLNMISEIRSAFGCTTLTLAHAGKEAGRGIRGSSAFTGGFDAIWFLEANKENRTAKLEALWLKDADELGPHCFRMQTVYVEGMGSGAVLRYLPMAEYKTPAEKGMAVMMLRARIAQLLTEHKVTAADEWTHKIVTEKLMPTPRPDRNEVGNNKYLAWETAYKELYKEVSNASRSAEGMRMGAKKVLQVGGALTWVWFLPEGS